jgi:hypothetical protein
MNIESRTRRAGAIKATIFGRTGETVAVKTSSTWRTSKSFAIEFTVALASESISLKSISIGATLEAFAFEATTFRWAGETFSIVTTSRGWAIEPAALTATTIGAASVSAAFRTATGEAWAHGWTKRPAPVESCVPGRSTWAVTFEARAVRTSRAAGPPHVLTDGFRHFHEFVFAELAVFIFVEPIEHLGWIRALWTATAFWAASAGGAALAFAGLTASTSTAHLAHFFAGFGAFFVV